MCGLVGVIASGSQPLRTPEPVIVRMRDALTHRGPDDAGLWTDEHAAFGHRRLAVIDPTPAGHQPMLTPDGRFVLLYNGELYNDAELRAELVREGVEFRSSCDTETVLHTVSRHGTSAPPKLRGMYAIACYHIERRRLLLARDPLGIKPLFWTRFRENRRDVIAFASEAHALFAHPSISPEPDPVAISAYLTTIRTTLGRRTLFRGINTLEPGQCLEFDLSGDTAIEHRSDWWDRAHEPADARTADVITDSITRHLRTDVPMCSLLSGGLDSAIVASIARERTGSLNTYCSGCRDAEPIDGVPQSEDFRFAQLVSDAIGTAHHEAPVSRAMFAERWGSMVNRLGMPLSTPNEVAINEVARSMRSDGNVVTLSGEGADELFGGYEAPIRGAQAYIDTGDEDPGVFQLISNAWTPIQQKPAVLSAELWSACEGDAHLIGTYREQFERVRTRAVDPLAAHLAFHRRVNLEGLLRRLDTATMLESVEGRTPFADAAVAMHAEGMPSGERCRVGADSIETKRPLREGFRDRLPTDVVSRPKASFPLPFQVWVGDVAPILLEPGVHHAWFNGDAVRQVASDPKAAWQYAWPMINLALWGRRWWA